MQFDVLIHVCIVKRISTIKVINISITLRSCLACWPSQFNGVLCIRTSPSCTDHRAGGRWRPRAYMSLSFLLFLHSLGSENGVGKETSSPGCPIFPHLYCSSRLTSCDFVSMSLSVGGCRGAEHSVMP